MKPTVPFPTIDVEATGRNIERLRKYCGLSVQDVQEFFGFASPATIYRWQKGECLPNLDNLYALSALLRVSMNCILVPEGYHTQPEVMELTCLATAPDIGTTLFAAA